MPSKKKVGKGGVVILWHKRLSHFITPLSIDGDIIVGVQLQIAPSVYAFIFRFTSHVATTQLQYISNILTNCRTCITYTRTKVLLYF